MLQTIAIYLLKTIVVSALLLVYYWFALRNKRFHYYNRFYLLATVVLSLSLPLLNLSFFTVSSNSDDAINMFNVIYAGGGEADTIGKNSLVVNWQQIVLLIAVAITLILLIRLSFSIIRIYKIKRKFPVNNMQEFDFINTDLQQAPFSFLRNIFWRNDISLEENTGRLILQHELAHIKQKHTWDKLFMQVVCAVLWANPLYRLIQKELYLIHEFIADDKSVTDKGAAAFAEMLLHAHYGKFGFDPAQPFFYSPIKRRLIMLTTSKEPRFSYVRRIMALPLIACTVLLFAFRLQKENIETVSTSTAAPAVTFKLVVDAGHGGTDNGATWNGLYEKDLALALSKKVKALSAEYGIEVVLTRDNDIYMSPQDKVNFAGSQAANAFLSIHVNAADAQAKDNSGMEIVIANNNENNQLNKSKVLGSALIQELSNGFTVKHALIQKQTGIWVLQANQLPAVLVECGYMTNAADIKNLTDDKQLEVMARKMLEAVSAYANQSATASYKVQTFNASFKDTIAPAPLYILDGKEIDTTIMKVIDPQKIESVNVLKDKSATDKYGIKGKNGVVEIKTKIVTKIMTDVKPVITLDDSINVVYVVDGKPVTKVVVDKIDATTITSVNVIKPSVSANVTSKASAKAVVSVTTKNSDKPLYIVNGNIISADEFESNISSEDITSMNVLKGEAATKAYGDKGKNGVIIITTKNKNSNKDSTQNKP